VQKSVWLHSFDCVNEIVLLRKIFEIEPYVKIVLVDALEEDLKIRKLFGLI